jgi:hypothetical protein
MKTLRMPGAYLFLLVLLQAFVSPNAANAQSSVPFKATVSIAESIQVVGSAPCLLVGNISGTGTATHVGNISVASTDCINPISETAFSFFSLNKLVITAANGDQIFATYSGTLSVQGQFGVISGGYLIVGGTGRYTRATGAGTLNGQEDLVAGRGQIQLFGTISN